MVIAEVRTYLTLARENAAPTSEATFLYSVMQLQRAQRRLQEQLRRQRVVQSIRPRSLAPCRESRA